MKDDLPSVAIDVASQTLVVVAVERTSMLGVAAEVASERLRAGLLEDGLREVVLVMLEAV